MWVEANIKFGQDQNTPEIQEVTILSLAISAN
jgi:hypothetical protein